MQDTTLAIPSPSPATSKPSTGGTTLTAIATLVLGMGFVAAATATKGSDVTTAGWLLGIGAAVAMFGGFLFPVREPRLAVILGTGSLLAGVLAASTGDLQALFVGLAAYGISVTLARRTSTIGRIVGGIAALCALVAMGSKGRDARDIVPVAMYLFAATSVLDAIAHFTSASRIGRQGPAAQRKPTMT
ncbi:MAG: hypothetical protein AB7T06_28315 [Kofleriaceae bacterium]